MLHVPGLYIAESDGRGRGVFTAKALSKGDVIELCPLVIIPEEDHTFIHKSVLHDYYFLSPAPHPKMCIVLGYGSIYNHANSPNADIIFDIPNQQLEIHCMKVIPAGEEIFIDYTGGLKDAPKLWFTPA